MLMTQEVNMVDYFRSTNLRVRNCRVWKLLCSVVWRIKSIQIVVLWAILSTDRQPQRLQLKSSSYLTWCCKTSLFGCKTLLNLTPKTHPLIFSNFENLSTPKYFSALYFFQVKRKFSLYGNHNNLKLIIKVIFIE